MRKLRSGKSCDWSKWVISSGVLLAAGGISQGDVLSIGTAQGTNAISGDWQLNAGTGQTVDLYVAGSSPVTDTDVYIQIGDGGTANSGSDTEPVITNADATTGIFASDNTTNSYAPDGGLIAADGTSTNDVDSEPTTVIDNGLLDTITLDTSALSPGDTFSIEFFDVGANSFGPVDTSLNNEENDTSPMLTGPATESENIEIVAVPEPVSGAGVVLLSTLGLLRRSRRKSAAGGRTLPSTREQH